MMQSTARDVMTAEPAPGGLLYTPAWRTPEGKASGFRLAGVNYVKMLAHLQKTLQLERYLEIGTNTGSSINAMSGRTVCIDPVFKIERNVWANKEELHLYQLTSDEYFRRHDPKAVLGGPVQLAFIDGLHHYEFVLRDILNVERHCTRDSVIVLHDCVPWKFSMTRRLGQREDGSYEDVTSAWTGDVWKALPILRKLRPDLKLTFLDCPPTGLVAITKLDPASKVLLQKMDAAVAEADRAPDTPEAFWAWLEAQQLTDTRRMERDAASLRKILGLK